MDMLIAVAGEMVLFLAVLIYVARSFRKYDKEEDDDRYDE